MQKAHEKLRAEWAKEDAAVAASQAKIRAFFGVGKSDAEDFAQIAGQTFQQFADGVGQSYAKMIVEGKNFSTSMKDAFKNMAESFIADVTSMIVKWMELQLVTGIMGGFGGAPAGSFMMSGMAEGGPVNRGEPYIVGERGPELFVPGQDGHIIPQSELQGRTEIHVHQTFSTPGVDLSSMESARKLMRAQAAAMRSGAIEALTFAQAATDQATKNAGRSRG